MIDLRIKGLPNSIESLKGEPIFINTDFRVWIRFWKDLEQFKYHIIDEVDCSYLFLDEPPIIDEHILNQLELFMYNPSSTPKSESSEQKTLDYVEDGEYIYSAFMQLYGIDLTECDLHWHKFQALANNIVGDSTLWGYARSMRGYEKPSKNHTQEKACQRAKEAWAFPIELTLEEQKQKNEFDSYFDI